MYILRGLFNGSCVENGKAYIIAATINNHMLTKALSKTKTFMSSCFQTMHIFQTVHIFAMCVYLSVSNTSILLCFILCGAIY